MKHCSSQHWTLLSPPDTSTTEHWFSFGPATSFFLELLVIALHSSPVAYCTPSDLEGSSSGVVSFCLIVLFVRSHSQNTGVVRRSLPQWTSLLCTITRYRVHPGPTGGPRPLATSCQRCTISGPMPEWVPTTNNQLARGTQTTAEWWS